MSNVTIPLLTSEDIEVKIKQATKNGALGLLYKTARVDRRILNSVFGPMNWTNDYKVIDGTLFCGIGIRESSDQDFVWKWDAGGESENVLDDGARSKATASDALKRAGFTVGIGEELYTSPVIWLEVETVPDGNKWRVKDPFAKYVVTHIAYNESTRVITELEIANSKTNVVVYRWKLATSGAIGKKMVNTLAKSEEAEDAPPFDTADTKPSQAPVKASQQAARPSVATKTTTDTTPERLPLKRLVTAIGGMVKNMYTNDGSADKYTAIVKEVSGDSGFKCNTATEEQYETVYAIYAKLIEGGYGG